MAKRAVVQYNMPVKWACQAFSISETCYRYEAKLNTENDEIADWLIRLTDNNRTWATLKTLFGTTNVCIGFTRLWS
jgi:putative transposase